jgi:hypothetical protein
MAAPYRENSDESPIIQSTPKRNSQPTQRSTSEAPIDDKQRWKLIKVKKHI